MRVSVVEALSRIMSMIGTDRSARSRAIIGHRSYVTAVLLLAASSLIKETVGTQRSWYARSPSAQ